MERELASSFLGKDPVPWSSARREMASASKVQIHQDVQKLRRLQLCQGNYG